MCEICNRIEKIKNGENPYFVKELETGYVVIGDNQHFYGYSLFLCKKCVSELFELEPDYRIKHLMEMSVVAQAVYNCFSAEKMNYECLGNGESHIHWHLFPRKKGDMKKPGPVWWLPPEEMWSDENVPTYIKLEEMKSKLKAEIERLL
ncbi:MAG: HIT family protein [Eubacterium sp.]